MVKEPEGRMDDGVRTTVVLETTYAAPYRRASERCDRCHQEQVIVYFIHHHNICESCFVASKEEICIKKH
jgi:hypothetical protein